MAIKILPIDDVIERTGLSRRTLYHEISEGRFPKSVQLTSRRVGWPEDEIETWLSDKIAARDSGLAA